MRERTLVMIKPDAVKRGLVGEIITTFERAGLQITKLKMLRPSRELAEKHYPDDDEWYAAAGGKTLKGYKEYGLNVQEALGTEDPIAIGHMIKNWLVEFLTSGEVVTMIIEGNLAVSNVRRLCGHTLPIFAEPGSIRGRYSVDSPDMGNAEKRPVYNLIHASGTPEEAEAEIKLWFGDQSQS